MSDAAREPPAIVLPLRAWLAASHLVVLLLPVIGLVLSGALGQDLVNQTRDDLGHQALLLAMLAEGEVRQARHLSPQIGLQCCSSSLSARLRRVKGETLAGIQIIDADGMVVATSGRVLGEDLSEEPHVQAALAGRARQALKPRPPPSHAQSLRGPSRRARVRVFVAHPVEVSGAVVGAVVISRTPREELQAFVHMAPRAGWAAVVAFLLTLVVAFGAGILATRSLRRLDDGAERIAEGDFGGIDELAVPTQSHVAEVNRVARSLTRMASRLRERLGYIGEFASNVSHEFKTPLATLRGTVELLADDPGMTAPQRDRFLGNAAREVDRLERLVQGLLALARADTAPPSGFVNLQELLDGLDVPVQGAAGHVRGDRAQLEAVLVNLVDNALTHGGEGVHVHVVGWMGHERTGFDVIDDGPGISAANLPRVFDRFFTTDRGGTGTGLGLALVRAVAQRHGGEVTLDSRPGHTRVRVSLPRGAVVAVPGPTAP